MPRSGKQYQHMDVDSLQPGHLHSNSWQSTRHNKATSSVPACLCACPGVFNWIVAAINAKLDMGKKGSGRFIAILDIYGFEQFQVNR